VRHHDPLLDLDAANCVSPDREAEFQFELGQVPRAIGGIGSGNFVLVTEP
jgi:hypothetical protein